MITLGSLFDGIGGALLCAKMCGAVPVWASEIEPFPIKVTAFHFPEVKHLGDITQINGAAIDPVDIIVGGSPCQDLSVAGKRAGMAGARSGLFMEQIRIVKEMRNATDGVRPRFMVWENVPGAFSSNSGEDFRAVLEETARVADGTVSIPRSEGWSNAGSVLGNDFSISWRTLDAQYWGVPQRRRRIYLVADFGGQSAPEILFESESVSGDIAQSRIEGQGTAEDVERCFGAAGFNHLMGAKAHDIGYAEEQAPTCRSAGPDAVLFQPKSALDENWAESDVKNALRSGESKVSHAVCYSNSGFLNFKQSDVSGAQRACVAKQTDVDLVCYDMTHAADVIRESGDKTTVLQHRMGTGGNQVPLVARMVAFGEYATDGTASAMKRRDHKDATDLVVANCLKAKANLSFRDDSDTLVVAGCDFRNDKENGDLCGTLQAKPNGGFSYNCIHPVRIGKTVRRLTPLECERLQGYPDNYTNIPGASDSARYKALGNSFAIPCADFVIRRCKEAFYD